jgi:uncharacterized protein YjiS (DUF1127 family)
MISHYSIPEQLIPGSPVTEGHRNAPIVLPGRMVFNCKRWLRNRRELRGLDNDQLRDVGLSREMVEQACRLNLLRQ